MPKITISPVTRISGLLSIDLVLDPTGTVQEANCSGEQFRGFELMLKGRRPEDAVYFTERICGICSMAHGYTSARLVRKILGLTPTPEMILLEQCLLGAEFLQNHIRHFYLLALPDYLPATALPQINEGLTSIMPQAVTESRMNRDQERLLVDHYFQAIEAGRKCHEMLAIFGGKIPHQHGLTAAALGVAPTASQLAQFRSLLHQVQEFIQRAFLPDLYFLAANFPDYETIGAGPGRFLSFGLFDPRYGGHFPSGIVADGIRQVLNPTAIREEIRYSWYRDPTGDPEPGKSGAYSWVKAPRYQGLAFEGGPLARKIVASGLPGKVQQSGTISRVAARAEEAASIASWMEEWLNYLPETGRYTAQPATAQNEAIQINDAPRGPLLHAMAVSDGIINRYTVITPSTWNFSPKDDHGGRGPAESALVGTILADPQHPLEAGRIIRAFDPCLSCATHLIDRQGNNQICLIFQT